MIARIPFTIPFVLCVLSVPAQQLANGGFENWSQQYVFTQLDQWDNANWRYPGLANTTQVPGTAGLYGVHLETHIIAEDTVFGFIAHGTFVDDVPVSGVPFTTEVERIRGNYRYETQTGDSALMVVGLWSGGVLVSFDAFTIGGSQLAWTVFDFAVNMGDPVMPDSVIVAVASSNPFAPANILDGSWIELDNIRLTSSSVPVSDVLPNAGMEDWYDVNVEEPDDWGTFNFPLLAAGLTPVTKSTNAHNGSFSARLETLDLGGDTLPGVIGNGTISFMGAMEGEPFVEMPLSLDGWFMYEPAGTDTAVIYAQFLLTGVPVGTAAYQFTSTVTDWTFFSAPVTILMEPDTLVLVVFSGDNPGSVLHLDDLGFDGLFTEVRVMERDAAFLFPNPTNDQVSIHVPYDMRGALRVRVMDATGRTVIERSFTGVDSGPVRLPVDGLSPGRYVVELSGSGRTERLTFVRN